MSFYGLFFLIYQYFSSNLHIVNENNELNL